MMSATAVKGKLIALEYSFKSEDNQVNDSNVGKAPFTYTQGANQVISGIESAVEGMMIGETKQVVVSPLNGFSEHDPHAVMEVDRRRLPGDIQVGTQLGVKGTDGRDHRSMVTQVNDHTALLDFNHPLAGKTLFFDLKVVAIE
jgi:FKBP-type peptidyl-prolyl cis-trans isomerase 2